MRYNGPVPRRTHRFWIIAILLAAAWLRIYRLDEVPPGWRDDEVVETTVHAALAATGAPSADAISLLVIPIAAAAVIFLGLRPYPVIGRLRLAMMTAVALFIVGLGL